MSAQALDSFFVELFFKGDTTAAKQFDESLTNIHTSALKVSAVMVGAAAGLLAFVGGVAHGMGELQDFAETNDMSASKLDALGKVAKATDVDMEQLKSSIAGLNGITGEAALGIGRGAMIFEKLGLSAKDASGNVRSVDEMLEVVADKIKGLPRAEQLAMLGKLRIDPNMVKLLKDGGAALRQMREEAEGKGLFTDADYDRADKLDKLFGRSTVALGQMAKLLAVNLFPAVEKILTGFLDFYNAQRKATSGTFITAFKMLGLVIERLYDQVANVINKIAEFTSKLLKIEPVAWSIAGAFGMMVSYGIAKFFVTAASAAYKLAAALFSVEAAAFLPMAALGAVIALIFMIYDDIEAARKGQESFTKDLNEFIKSLGVMGEVLTAVVTGIVDALAIWAAWALIAWGATLGPLSLAIVWISALTLLFFTLKDQIKAAGQYMLDFLLSPLQSIKNIWDSIIGNKSITASVDLVKKSSDTQASLPAQAGGINSTGGLLGNPASQSSVNSANTNNITLNQKIEVKSNNGEEASRVINRDTREAVRNAQNSVAN